MALPCFAVGQCWYLEINGVRVFHHRMPADAPLMCPRPTFDAVLWSLVIGSNSTGDSPSNICDPLHCELSHVTPTHSTPPSALLPFAWVHGACTCLLVVLGVVLNKACDPQCEGVTTLRV